MSLHSNSSKYASGAAQPAPTTPTHDSHSQHIADRSQSVRPPKEFTTYKEYEDALDSLSPTHTDPWVEDLWLGQFHISGQALRWYRFSPHWEPGSQAFVTFGSGANVYKITNSTAVLRTQLSAKDPTISQQVIVMGYYRDKRTGHDYNNTFRIHDPFDWIIDTIGLELDMPPNIWEHMRCRKQELPHSRSWSPIPLIENRQVFDIGDSSLVLITEAQDKVPTAEVILFVPEQYFPERFDPKHIDYRVPSTVGRSYCSLLPHAPPSLMSHQTPALCTHAAVHESQDIWSLRRLIQQSHEQPPQSEISLLFTCFRSLVELYLSTPSFNMPFLDEEHETGDWICLKYAQAHARKESHLSFVLAPRTPIRINNRELWMALRAELDAQRIMSLRLKSFKSQYINSLDDEHKCQLLDLLERLDTHLRTFEIAEASLRDRIAIYSSESSTGMAEQSIKESKRIILLTAFAFVFLPLSLASSIFGMNVRQINQTGHSITAFLVTAVVLCVTTFAIWGAFAALMSYRNRLISGWTGEDTTPLRRLEWIFIGPPRYWASRLLGLLKDAGSRWKTWFRERRYNVKNW